MMAQAVGKAVIENFEKTATCFNSRLVISNTLEYTSQIKPLFTETCRKIFGHLINVSKNQMSYGDFPS